MDKDYVMSYISGACNSTPNAAAWGLNDIIAYGSCNAVNLYDPRQHRVTQTLVHHTRRVNSVQWIKFNHEPEQEFITSSSDKTAAVWTQNNLGDFEVTAHLKGHTDVVNCADALYPSFVEWEDDIRTLVAATASVDSSVILWKRNKSEKICEKAAIISLKDGLCLSLRLFILGGQCPILALAADDSSIHLYSLLFKNACEIVYNKVYTLTGHENWVRSLDFIEAGDNCLLASASEDSTIRLWRFETPQDVATSSNLSNISIEGKTFIVETGNGLEMKWNVRLESVLSGHEGWVYGLHWSVQNLSTASMSESNGSTLRLLSASLDKTMILWAPSESDVWLEEVRVGEVGGNTLGFYGCQISPDGESILAHGYNGSFHLWHKSEDGGLWKPGVTVGGHFGEVADLCWEPGGQFLVSVSADQTTRLHAPWAQTEKVTSQDVVLEVWDRAWMNKRHLTKLLFMPKRGTKSDNDSNQDTNDSKSAPNAPRMLPGAKQPADPAEPHMAELADFAIKRLLSLKKLPEPSKCEIRKAWKQVVGGMLAGFQVHLEFPANHQWHEIGRPQVHGYDLQCLAILSRYRFASGAEEKVIRAFQAPANFVDNFCRLCGVEDEEARRLIASTPSGASVPSLGLSNKAVYQSELGPDSVAVQDDSDEGHFKAVALQEPPTEEHLVQNTLWPEVQKLYGHGYELYSLAASHNGLRLASACRASSQQHAAVIMWDAKSWVQIQTLASHQLTVTQMSFSPNDRYLLTVSRDRRWSLFESAESKVDDLQEFKLVATTNKTNGMHTRVIWCCSWTHNSKYFATGSREGKVVVWGSEEKNAVTSESSLGQWKPNLPALDLPGESVNSVDFAPQFVGGESRYLLAVGLDSGGIQLFWWKPNSGDTSWTHIISLKRDQSHHLGVKRLAFRPVLGEAGSRSPDPSAIQLASCGADHAVKVHTFSVEKLCASSS